MHGSLAGVLRIKNLGRNVFVVQQPTHGINFMDDGVGDGHIGGIIVTDAWIAMGAMSNQRRTDNPLGDDFL